MNPSYVFDPDGTLIDSMSHFGAAMTGILDDAGVSYGEDLVNPSHRSDIAKRRNIMSTFSVLRGASTASLPHA